MPMSRWPLKTFLLASPANWSKLPYKSWIQRFFFSAFVCQRTQKGPWDAVCIANETHSKARRKPQRNNYKAFGELRETKGRKRGAVPFSWFKMHSIQQQIPHIAAKTNQAKRSSQTLKIQFLQPSSEVKNKTNFIFYHMSFVRSEEEHNCPAQQESERLSVFGEKCCTCALWGY